MGTQVLDDLLISLSLDPRKFMEGLRQTLEASKKGQQQIVKNAQEIENQTNKSSDSINKLTREFQQFFSIIGGALGVNALKSLVEHMAMADAAVGRMAANLGTTPQALSAWGYAAQRLGGDAQAADASIAGLRSRVFKLTNFGEDPGTNFWRGLARGGVSNSDFLNTKDPYGQMMKIATAIQNIERREGRAQAYSYAKESFNLDEGSTNVILQGGDKLKAMLESISHIVPTDKDVLNAQKMQEAWAGLTQQMEALARLSYEPLTRFLKYLTETLKVFGGEKSAVEANRDMSDDPDSYVGPHAFARYYNRLARKRGSTSRAYDGTSDSGIFGSVRRFFYGNEGEEGGPRDSTGGPSAESSGAVNPESSAAATGGGSAYLAKTRESFFAELDRDPALRRDVIKAASMEGGLQSNIEQMVNYAQLNKMTSLRQALHSGFYGPVNRGGLRFGMSRGTRAKGEEAIAAVRGGSNIIDYRTDQGMWSDPNGGWYRNHPGLARYKKVENANFFDFRGRGPQWAAEQRENERKYNLAHQTPYSAAGVDWSLYGSSFAPRTSDAWNKSISNSSQMYLNGPISIQTQATNADGFARDLRPAIEAQTSTFYANGGAH